jgi:hypothetical protein
LETEQIPEISLEDLYTVEKYVWALIEAYPVPINQTEIAKKVNVSRSAVTRIRDSLMPLTVMKTLAWDKKLLLKNDLETRVTLFSMYLWQGSPNQFKAYVGSLYFSELIMDAKFYEKIVEEDTQYSFDKYYSKEDFDWMKRFFLRKFIDAKPIIEDELFIVSNRREGDFVYEFMWQNLPLNLQFLYSVFYDSSLSFLDAETDFMKLLELRDKTHLFLRKNKAMYSEILQDFAIWIEAEGAKNQRQIEDASEVLFLAFFKKMLNMFSDYVFEEAEQVGITLNTKYRNIGSVIKSI